MQLLRTIGWLACVVYSTIPLFWLMVHPRAHIWREKERSPFRVLVPAWVVMWFGVGALTGPWRKVVLYFTPWPWLPAVALFAIGIFIYFHAGARFSWAQLGGLPEVRANHRDDRLVTTGIRARVRHPVYLAHLCEMLAWSVGTGLVVCWALTGFAVVTGAVMIGMEDAELERRFGAEYCSYRSEVSAVLPKLFKRTSQSVLRPPVREIIGDLVAALDAGAASIQVKTATGGEEYILVTPANHDAAEIYAYGGAGDWYQLTFGAGTVMDRLEEEDVRQICQAVFAGRFEETIWVVGSDITKTKGKVHIGGRTLRETHWFSKFYPFRKKEKRFVKYAPYAAGQGSHPPEATRAI